LISSQDATAVRWQEAFGKLIANTDQHFGNVSFFTEETGGFRLCPAYDVLPMHYRPSGETAQYETPSATIGLAGEWDDARKWSRIFWRRASEDNRISETFREIAAQHAVQQEPEETPRFRPG